MYNHANGDSFVSKYNKYTPNRLGFVGAVRPGTDGTGLAVLGRVRDVPGRRANLVSFSTSGAEHST
jgi:hypothetical protein